MSQGTYRVYACTVLTVSLEGQLLPVAALPFAYIGVKKKQKNLILKESWFEMLGCETEEEFVESVVMRYGSLSASGNSEPFWHPHLPRHKTSGRNFLWDRDPGSMEMC